jgi:xylulokinase
METQSIYPPDSGPLLIYLGWDPDLSGKQYLLGIDLGTMGVKSTLYSIDGEIEGNHYQEYALHAPFPRYAEQSQIEWWEKTKLTIKTILAQSQVSSSDILGIGVCGQGHGLSSISKDGEFLYPCITWVDQRTDEEVQWILENVGEEKVLRINMFTIDNAYTAPKILWLRNNVPHAYENAKYFLLPTDVIKYFLTGTFSTDVTNAYATDMFDVRRQDWSDELLDDYGIPRDKLPNVYRGEEVIGEVSEKAAHETGLAKGISVVAGGLDAPVTFYGAGFVKPGRGVDMTGTVGVVMIAGGPGAMPLSIVPGVSVVGWAGSQAAASIYRWYKNQFCKVEDLLSQRIKTDVYQLMNQQAERVPPGSKGLIVTPNFIGQRRPGNINSRGIAFGLNLTTTKAQINRAILEGLAYEIRRSLQSILATGVQCDEIRAIGGGGKSRLWRQIKADVIGIPYCRINIDEGGTFGAAVMAGVGVGVYSDLVSPIERIIKVVEREEPRDEYKEIYNDLYNFYCTLEGNLENGKVYNDYATILKRHGLN